MKEQAIILDACCGGKMFYFDKEDPRVLFQDNRTVERVTLTNGQHFSVQPDVIGDFTQMSYNDESFSMVVFDPPHLKGTSEKEKTGWQMLKYGYLPKQWKDILQKGFSECFRVLKPGGFLVFKWNETDIKVSEILKLTPVKPVFGHKSGKQSKTHWIIFMKEV